MTLDDMVAANSARIAAAGSDAKLCVCDCFAIFEFADGAQCPACGSRGEWFAVFSQKPLDKPTLRV